MSEHLGKICPYCKAEFKETDDVVQCNQCDMPHHKDCFIENRGCTTFGCSGAMSGAAPGDSSDGQGHLYCSRCGTMSSARNAFCGNCGSPLGSGFSPPPPPPFGQQPPFNAYNTGSYADQDDELAEIYHFTQKNTNYYATKFHKLKASGGSASWNWPAFLFSFIWCAYRKMYATAFVIMGINVVLLFVPGSFLNLIVSVVTGIMGNYFYLRHFEQERGKVRLMPDAQRQQYLSHRGGTSAGAVWGVIILWIILAAIVN